MALSPFGNQTDVTEEAITPLQPSKTYRLDLDSGRIGGLIDGRQAIQQAVYKAFITPRFRFNIYGDDYGSELQSLLGRDITDEFLRDEVPRMVRDTAEADDRIEEVTDVEIAREGDKLYVTVTYETVDGLLIEEGVTLEL